METRSERKKRFAELFAHSRTLVGMSQEAMAIELNVSRSTIRNWESGVSAPNAEQFISWFDVLHLNPLPWFLSFYYGESIDQITGDGADSKAALHQLIDTFTNAEAAKLLFCISGNHGSSWGGMLNLTVAHLQTDLRARIINAKTVLNNYMLLESIHALSAPDGVKPDVEMLRKAIIDAGRSFECGGKGYTVNI